MKSIGWICPAAIASALILLSGCDKSGTDFSLSSAEQEFTQSDGSFSNKLDILFVVDDQPNMSAFQAALVTSMSTFMNTFQTKGFDYKIAVVTTSGYLADPALSGYSSAHVAEADFNDFNGTVYSGAPVLFPWDLNLFDHFAINAKPSKNSAGQDARAFSSFRQALQSSRPVNAGFLRPDSFLAVVIVDNQEDFSGNGRCNGCNTSGRYNAPTLDPVGDYVDFLDEVTGTSGAGARYNVSAMTQIATPCQGGSNMVRIMDLVSLTNGVMGDICQSDFGPSMAAISNQITMLSTRFFLDREPVAGTISVAVNGVSVPENATNGWSYDAEANAITFHGSATPQQGSVISVDFDPVNVQI
jgi:hypothetical protein